MTRQIGSYLFVAASLLPACCLIAGATLAGIWPLVALTSMTVLVFLLDRLDMEISVPNGIHDVLPWTIAAAHFFALAATLWATGRPDHLDFGQTLCQVIAMGLFAGQVANAIAHELIHRPRRAARRLGTAIYVSLLNGQHVSAHLLLHHPHAGTDQDPCSAPLGRGYYRFALAASAAEFAQGWRAETERQRVMSRRIHPYVIYLGGAAVSAVIAWVLGGVGGLLALVIVALHAQSQLLLSDYVQHYGLRRSNLPSGKSEPIGPQHSWNAPHSFSAALLLNAPRHSDHHMHPARTFPELSLDATAMPMLPYSLPVMGLCALIPPLWRRIMDPRVRAWMPTGRSGAREPFVPAAETSFAR